MIRVTKEPCGRRPESLGCRNEVDLLDGQDGRASDARVGGDGDDSDRDEGVLQSWAENGNDGNGEQE